MTEVERAFERFEAKLEEIRQHVARLEERLKPEPTCLTYPKAAERLGVSLSKLKRMVKAKEIRTAHVGQVPMITVAEVHRVSTPPSEQPKLAAAKRKAEWVDIPVGRPPKKKS